MSVYFNSDQTSPRRLSGDLTSMPAPQTIQFKPITAKQFNGEEVVIMDESGEGYGRSCKIKNIQVSGISFLPKEKCKDSAFCLVCQIDIDKLKGRDHCRTCGNTVCTACSRKTINDMRVCDLCFMRNFLRYTMSRQNVLIDSKKKTIQDIQVRKAQIESEISRTEKQIRDIMQEQQDPEDIETKLQDKLKGKQIAEEQLESKKKRCDQKKKDLEVEQDELFSVQQELQQITTQLGQVNTEIAEQNGVLEQKRKQFDRFNSQKQKIMNSKSFAAYQNKDQRSKLSNPSDQSQQRGNGGSASTGGSRQSAYQQALKGPKSVPNTQRRDLINATHSIAETQSVKDSIYEDDNKHQCVKCVIY